MRIVSLNAWGGAMFPAFAGWLPTCGADIVCLQEVTRTPGLIGWTHFADGERQLPQRANLFDDARRLLPRHQGLFVASDAGPVYDGDDVRHQQDFGIATFVHESIAVIGHCARFVHGAFTDHHEWTTSDRPRIAHQVRVVDRSASRVVSVIHVHGLRDPSGKGDTEARREQAWRLASMATRSLEDGDLVVLCGDLNLLPDSETFAILAEVGLTDLVGDRDTRTSRYTKTVRHANYLLISDPRQVRRFDVATAPEVSDHRAMVLEI